MAFIYQYYVEGENEKKLVEVLSKEFNFIKAGKVEVLNVVEKPIEGTHTHRRNFKKNHVIILVFDTDTNNVETLEDNIKYLKDCVKSKEIKDVVLIPQVRNIEEELVRSCNISDIKDLLKSKSKKEFKTDFNKATNLKSCLTKKGFDFKKLWRTKPVGVFSGFKCELSKLENRNF